MSKRIKLGIIFSLNNQWIGGTYYILNLIHALKTLPSEKQPIITILSKNENDFETAKETGYPFIKYRNPYLFKRNLAEKIIDKICKITSGKYYFDKRISEKDIDIIFPARNEYEYENIKNKLFWFADFQFLHYPQFFSQDEIMNNNIHLQTIANSGSNLVLSSNDALSDFEKLNYELKGKIFVVPFAVTHTRNSALDFESIKEEYLLQENYFIVSNQFWVHKNHILVLKALKILKEKNISINIVFTGKEDDYRNSTHFAKLKDYVKENNLETCTKFLGLIEREKQLILMKHAIAVIQPSLFEGWSTVVEDAKAIGSPIIASDINVHKEQLGESGIYFDANNEIQLADILLKINKININYRQINYTENVREFANKFYYVIQNTVKD